jgi:hypothetical protein
MSELMGSTGRAPKTRSGAIAWMIVTIVVFGALAIYFLAEGLVLIGLCFLAFLVVLTISWLIALQYRYGTRGS